MIGPGLTVKFMPTEKDKMLRKSVDVLIDKAQITRDLAKDQRKIADHEHASAIQQHQAAHRLEALSLELADGAKDLKKKMDELPK
jgi:hypothetical protein